MFSINKLTILSKRTWEDFVKVIRSVTLTGDPTVFPYAKAKITSKLIDPNTVHPLSLYVLKDHLRLQHQLHEVLVRDYDIDTFDQDGVAPDIMFRVEGESGDWMLAPPVVEVSQADGGIPVLVDGEHRCLLARKRNRKIRVVWIEEIPRQFPTVPLPVSWEEIKIFEKVPDMTLKRRYRYNTLSEFPDVSAFSKVSVTEKNFRYFFYRDLNSVATTGIRAIDSV